MNFRSQTLTSLSSTPASRVLSELGSALYGKVERSQRGNEFVASDDDDDDDDDTLPEAMTITHTVRNDTHQMGHTYHQELLPSAFFTIISLHAYSPLRNS
jgi:hypothetical protein